MNKRVDKKNKKYDNIKLLQFSFSSKNKKGVISDYLPWLLIAVAILAIFSLSALLLKDKGIEFIDKILSVFGGR